MVEDEREYFERRAHQEQEKARNCPDRSTAQIHARFAEAYEKRLAQAALAA